MEIHIVHFKHVFSLFCVTIFYDGLIFIAVSLCVVEKSNLTIMMPNLHVFLICVSYVLLAYHYVRGHGHPSALST